MLAATKSASLSLNPIEEKHARVNKVFPKHFYSQTNDNNNEMQKVSVSSELQRNVLNSVLKSD